MQKQNTINNIPQLEAETKQDRLILGLLHQEAERVQYGVVSVEFTIRGGDIDRAKLTEVSRLVNLGLRDGK